MGIRDGREWKSCDVYGDFKHHDATDAGRGCAKRQQASLADLNLEFGQP